MQRGQEIEMDICMPIHMYDLITHNFCMALNEDPLLNLTF